MKECSVSDCSAPARARGLCQKHYMRTRRHGDAEVTQRPGRKPDALYFAIARTYFPENSPRDQARFARALRMYSKAKEYLGVGDDFWEEAIKVAGRPNGSSNHALLERYVEDRVVMLLARARLQPRQGQSWTGARAKIA